MNETIEQLEIVDAGSEGMAVGRSGDLVVFVPFVVPGDVIDVKIVKKKKSFAEGRVIKIHRYSERRVDPWCSHFGICGGCRWQNMRYEDQLFFKQKQVSDNLIRIGKLHDPVIRPILPSPAVTHYRNKLEFTFSNHRWLTGDDKPEAGRLPHTNALGFHVPQFWDKVVDIRECFHQPEPSNAIRNAVRDYALQHRLSFYDARTWTGYLRNLIIRNSRSGEVMVIVVVRDRDEKKLLPLLDHIHESFPAVTSLYNVINPKQNDAIGDLGFHLYKGSPYITETLKPFREGGQEIRYRIGPASFFQTNPGQAENLFRLTAEYSRLKGTETVYDLYSGTGAMANYIAPYAGKVVGIESFSQASEDAEENAALNGITNAIFFTGETETVLTPEFIAGQGKPDVIITDPPRSGMHERVVKAILEAAPERLVYVSCNPATQARDIAWLSEQYRFTECQPVDMFPHTQHVENITLLERAV